MICLNNVFCILNKFFNANLRQPYCKILISYSLPHVRLIIERLYVSFFDVNCIIAITIMALKAGDLIKLFGNSDVKEHLTAVFSDAISGAFKLLYKNNFLNLKKISIKNLIIVLQP